MAVDSINFIAQQSYAQVQNRPKVGLPQEQVNKAVNFQNMVNKNFNSFARMSPAQILSHIQRSQAGEAYSLSSNIAASAADSLRSVISKQENTARKSLIGKASLIDLLTTTTEAKNLMDTTVMARNKFLDAVEKVMNMSM